MSYFAQTAYGALYLEGIYAPSGTIGTYSGLVTVFGNTTLGIHVATQYGPVHIASSVLPSRTEVDDSWEDIAEVSGVKAAGDEAWVVNGWDDRGEDPEPVIDGTAAGGYRLRIHRSGLGFADGQEPSSRQDPRMERLLILIWPEHEASDPAALKMSSAGAVEVQSLQGRFELPDSTDEYDERLEQNLRNAAEGWTAP